MNVTIEDAMVHPFVRELVEYGMAKAKAKGVATAILIVLDDRNLPVSQEVRERILACTDQETLKTWILGSLTATSIDELFE